MGEVIVCFIETGIVLLYFHFILGDEKGSWKKQIAGAVVTAIMISVINESNATGLDTAWKGVCIMAVQTAFAYFCFSGMLFEKLFYGASFSLIAIISDQVTFRMAGLMHIQNLDALLIPGKIRYEMMVVYYISCLLVVLFVVVMRKSRMTLPLRYQFPLMILFIGVLIAMDKLLDVVIMIDEVQGHEPMIQLMKFVCILLLTIFFATIFIVTRLARIYQERNDLQDRRRQDEFAIKEYENMKESVAALRGWRHDMRSHLSTVFELIEGAEEKQASEYIVRILGEMETSVILVNSGNPILDAIISNKAMRAKNAQIQFNYQIHSEYVVPLNPSEMTSVFGNILDNAIEGAMKTTDEKDRHISLQIKSVNMMIHIIAENGRGAEIHRAGKRFRSAKGEGHGIGLCQIERIAKKHGGFVAYEAPDSLFKISVYLPIIQEGNE